MAKIIPRPISTSQKLFNENGVGATCVVDFAAIAERSFGRSLPDTSPAESSRAFMKHLTERLNMRPSIWKTPQMQHVIDVLVPTEATQVAEAIDGLNGSLTGHLRNLVDLWIKTGKSVGRGDQPSARHLPRRIREIQAAITRTSSPVLIETPNGYRPKACETGDIRSDDDGGLRHAQGIFVELLCNDDRFRIAKCKECTEYFLLEQWNRIYKKGTVCKKCTPRNKSKRDSGSKKQSRQDADDALYLEAAKRFGREIRNDPTNWATGKELTDAIVLHLNRCIKQRPALRPTPIQAKWLGWRKNQIGIQEKVKELTSLGSL